MRLSARGYHRVLKLARTLADLDGGDAVRARPSGRGAELSRRAGARRRRPDGVAAIARTPKFAAFRQENFNRVAAMLSARRSRRPRRHLLMLDFAVRQCSFEARQLALQAGPFLALALALVVAAVRRRRSRGTARGAAEAAERSAARRGLAPEGGRRRARSRGGRERSQVALPGDDEPRDPHAAAAAYSAWPTCCATRGWTRRRELRRGDPRFRRRAGRA